MELAEFHQRVEIIFRELQDCVREYIESEFKKNHISSPSNLGLFTKRERQVLPLITRCCSNKEIAAALNISESTVKFHVASILRKTGTQSKNDLALRYQQGGNREFSSEKPLQPILRFSGLKRAADF